MKRGLYIIDKDEDELQQLKLNNLIGKFGGKGAFGLTIAPTLQCNFACPYCYEERQNGMMSKEVQDAIIKRVEKEAEDNPSVIIPKLAQYIDYPSNKVKAKVLWMLGELGLKNPQKIVSYVNLIAEELKNEEPKIRERAVGALGRIGRGKIDLIKPYFSVILSKAKDSHPDVRMNFIWTCENIATNTPGVFIASMGIFAELLDDDGIRVRREAPEIFRVIGKRRPDFAVPYITKLKIMSESDPPDDIVKIHAAGAIKAIKINQV